MISNFNFVPLSDLPESLQQIFGQIRQESSGPSIPDPGVVKKEAAKIRGAVLERYVDLAGRSHHWATRFVERLQQQYQGRLPCRVAVGTFRLDRPGPSELALRSDPCVVFHYWALVLGKYVDATASQYARHCDEKIPAVIFGDPEKLPRYRELHEDK